MLHISTDFEIIDAHTHPFLDYSSGCIGSYGSPGSMEEFDREMKKVGIHRYAGAPLVRRPVTDFAEILKLNQDALRIRDRFPSYLPGMQVHGAFPEESCANLHVMRKEGIRYIGELVPYIMKTGTFDSKGMLTILQEAEKLNMVVNLHEGTEKEIRTVREYCPDLKVILAHPGESWGENSAKKRFELLNRHKNLYMDLSGYGIFRWNMIRYGIDRCGADRFIFGSDMPTCSAGMYLYGVFSENLTEQELRLILAENFKRLLDL
ncbi:MAG: amidohydrolase family protein [Victivallales bacterium]